MVNTYHMPIQATNQDEKCQRVRDFGKCRDEEEPVRLQTSLAAGGEEADHIDDV